MVELIKEENVRFNISIPISLKHKIKEISDKRGTEPSKLIRSIFEQLDISNFDIIDKRTKIIVPLDDDAKLILLHWSTYHCKSMQQEINDTIRNFYE